MMKTSFTFLAALLPLVSPAPGLAGPRDANHLVNPGFEDNGGGKAKGWSDYGEGHELVPIRCWAGPSPGTRKLIRPQRNLVATTPCGPRAACGG
jgi:hypothetical protein